MDKMRAVISPFKQKGKGVKVYSGERIIQNIEEPKGPEEKQGCTCQLCRNGRGITREVRGQFNKYGKI